MKKLIPGICIAAVLWFVMFSPWTAYLFNFWAAMLFSSGILTIYSFTVDRQYSKEVYSLKTKWLIIGIVSAAILYLVFLTGNYISGLLFDFSHRQVTNIYSTKEQAAKIFIGFALLLWIGPAEEIFWHGFAQHNLAKRVGDTMSFLIIALIYALVHIWSFNFMLIMAALICGLFWGWMFMKYKSVVPGIISHALWDLFIFVIIPIS